MSVLAKQIQIDMVQSDLQQALDCLPEEHYDLSLHHIDQARAKVQQMKDTKDALPEAPKPTQKTLDI